MKKYSSNYSIITHYTSVVFAVLADELSDDIAEMLDPSNTERKIKYVASLIEGIYTKYKGHSALQQYNWFYEKFYKGMSNVNNTNSATIFFLTAIFALYQENNYGFYIFKDLKTPLEIKERNKRIVLFKEQVLSKLARYMYIIESKNLSDDYSDNNRTNKKLERAEFLQKREIGYLKMSGFNVYEDGFHYKEVLAHDLDYCEYYNRFKSEKGVMQLLFKELMSDKDFSKFQQLHKPNRPFWDSIAAMFLLTLNKLYRVHLNESYKHEGYVDAEEQLNLIVDIVGVLPPVERDIFLKKYTKTINTMHDDILKINPKLYNKTKEEYAFEPTRLSKEDTQIYKSLANFVELVPKQKMNIHRHYIKLLQNIIVNMQKDGKTQTDISSATGLDLDKIQKIIDFNN